MLHALVLAGGRGERFWPLSRTGRAKQFLTLDGTETLLAATLRRLTPLVPADRQWIVTGADQIDLARESAPEHPVDRIVGEPVGRNTAPAVAQVAARVARLDPEGVLIVVPSDAWVGDDEAWRDALALAASHAATAEALGTIGIVPSRPETGYGYLELGAPLDGDGRLRRVDRFVEKPDAATASAWLTGGKHLWNAGIFVMRAGVFLAALDRHLPGVAAPAHQLAAAGFDPDALARYYAAVPSISMDYGVMEKASEVFTVPGRFAWDDLGGWNALERILPRQGDVTASGDALAIDSPGSILYATDGLVAVVGLPDVVVVRTGDAVLVVPKARAQEVRRIVQDLKDRPGFERYR